MEARMRRRTALAVVVSAALVLAACGGTTHHSSSTPVPSSTPTQAGSSRHAAPSTTHARVTMGAQSTARPMCGWLKTPPTTYTHVIWIWFENHGYGSIV